jgi:general secretion pathway protein G
MLSNRLDNRGFSLIEIMVVIVIMGILVSVVAVNIVGRPDEARQLKAKMDIQNLETALKLYRLDNGRYPSTEQGLQALVEPPSVGQLAQNWRKGGYLEKGKVPKDPWGNEYIYFSPGIHGDFDITSYGDDEEQGGEDKDADINNWELE